MCIILLMIAMLAKIFVVFLVVYLMIMLLTFFLMFACVSCIARLSTSIIVAMKNASVFKFFRTILRRAIIVDVKIASSLSLLSLSSRDARMLASRCSKSKKSYLINFVFVFSTRVIVPFLFLISNERSLLLTIRDELTFNRSTLSSFRICSLIDFEVLEVDRRIWLLLIMLWMMFSIESRNSSTFLLDSRSSWGFVKASSIAKRLDAKFFVNIRFDLSLTKR